MPNMPKHYSLPAVLLLATMIFPAYSQARQNTLTGGIATSADYGKRNYEPVIDDPRTPEDEAAGAVDTRLQIVAVVVGRALDEAARPGWLGENVQGGRREIPLSTTDCQRDATQQCQNRNGARHELGASSYMGGPLHLNDA